MQGLTPVRIGTCSWADEALAKYFYPPKFPAKERLAYYAEHFDTVEVDSTYYRLPSESMVQGWADRTPDGFTIALIPETARRTTLGTKGPGDRVNLEVDPVARYAQGAIAAYTQRDPAPTADEVAWAYEI